MTLRDYLNDVACGLLAIVLALGVGLAQVSDPDAVKRRALALAQAGNYAEARADLERLVSERPDDRLARKLLARVLIAAGARAVFGTVAGRRRTVHDGLQRTVLRPSSTGADQPRIR
jgi:Tetratricopeptide repeat